MIITISGMPSSGKSTIAKMLSHKIGFKRYSVGDFIKSLAKDSQFNEFYKKLEKNPELERKIDRKQERFGEGHDNFIIEGRTSFHFMPKHKRFNIFFNLDLKTASERAYLNPKNSQENSPLKHVSREDAFKKTKERLELENIRYKKLYGIDHLDMKNYDVIIDASGTKEQVFEVTYLAITRELERRKNNSSKM